MMRHVASAFALVLATLPAAAQAPGLERVLSAATPSFTDDGGYDLAVLVDNLDEGADLYLYLGLDRNKLDAAIKPTLVKKDAAWSGSLFGTRASLAVNGKGALLIKSSNEAAGRGHWNETLTVVYRNKTLIVAGVTREERDTIDPKAGGACDLNFLSGKGTRDGKKVEIKAQPIPLAEWSEDRLPPECQF